MKDLKNVRVRFAPSPTGFLHVGGLRTALYNFLFARKHHGVFVLRIEDTDRSRFVEGAVANLIDTLSWSGLEYDEGPGKGGEFGPYIQSERLDVYKHHVGELLNKGYAYRCFCTPDRLEEMRATKEKMQLPVKYDRRCLQLTSHEVKINLENNVPFTVRMKVPDATTIMFHDTVRGDIVFESDSLDDQILMKSDGYPTYHLANVVDDHCMKISHVIRGEEWLSSTPKHVLLYQYFGWSVPVFSHLPLLLNPDRSKLSKRQGDVAVEDYRAKGYLKEALINFVALLGWNPGTEQEFFDMKELIDQFSLERVNKAGAVFSLDKLNWLNFEHLRRKPVEDVVRMLRQALTESEFSNKQFDDEYLMSVITAMRDRVTFVRDLLEKSPYFFEAPSSYNQDILRKRWKNDTPAELKKLVEEFSALQSSKKEDFERALHTTAQSLNIGNGTLIHAVRLAVSGVGEGPGVFDILHIIGKDESIRRIQTAIEKIK